MAPKQKKKQQTSRPLTPMIPVSKKMSEWIAKRERTAQEMLLENKENFLAERHKERLDVYLKPFCKRLLSITRDCRSDMHEPDEQEVSARIIGNHLDNACGDNINSNEFIVILSHGGTDPKQEHFNLATLIALARMEAERRVEDD